MDTLDYLAKKVDLRAEKAGVDKKAPEFHGRLSLTILEVAAADIDVMRGQLQAIALAATVGSLTTIGYQNALDQIKSLAAKALERN